MESDTNTLTYSYVCSKPDNLELPNIIKDKLAAESPNSPILSIYSINARALYFFPVNSDVLHVTISIYPLTPEIVNKIMTQISEFSPRVIYSTGLCLVENKCLWEGFFQESDLKKSIEEITELLSNIDEIKDIDIKKLQL